jgi:hypothetical protein
LCGGLCNQIKYIPTPNSSINFSTDSKLLCVSSNHSTIHVFALQRSSSLGKNLPLRRLEQYVKGDVSFTRLRVAKKKLPIARNGSATGTDEAAVSSHEASQQQPPQQQRDGGGGEGISQCAFDRDCESIIVLAGDGSYYNFSFNKDTGACRQRVYSLITELRSSSRGK